MEIEISVRKLCRICLLEGELSSIHRCLLNNDSSATIVEKINKFMNFNIFLNPRISNKICEKCIIKLEAACKFKSLVENSEIFFIDIIRKEDEKLFENNDEENINENCVIKNELNIEIETEDSEDENKDIDLLFVNDIDTENDDQVDNISRLIKQKYEIQKLENLYKPNKVSNVFFKKLPKEDTTSSQISHKKLKNVKGTLPKISLNKSSKRISVEKKIDSNPFKPHLICEICGNRYEFRHRLESHMRRHRNEKPFKCEICGKGFVINFELKRHLRTHTGEKPYSCKYCERKYSDYGSKIKHERTHTGERPYQCTECNMSFAYSGVLKNHTKIHTGLKPYECQYCSKKFTAAHHLKTHLNTHAKMKEK